MKTLDFSPDLKLPDDAVTQTFAFLARKGAGKTYGAGKLVEELHANGDQIIVVDPVGVWYGLRLAADGKKPGIPVVVLGGLHGDIPLEPTGGALVAKLLVEKAASVVLDVSQFRKNDRKRFVTDFAEELFHGKKSHRSPVHVVVEEAQVFVPQRVMGDEARMLGAFEDLIKLGRNFGIGVTLISQRPQSVNKDALNQTECLVVLQTNGAQERKAIEAWIVEQGLDVGELVDSLPSLERGEAWVWSPSWLGVTKRIRIGKKWTFDASATPERGAKAATVEPLDPVALDELAQAMAATIERAQAEDPKALRAKLLEARAELEKLKKEKPAIAPAPAKVRRVEVPVVKDAQIKRLETLEERARVALGELADAAAKFLRESRDHAKAVAGFDPVASRPAPPPAKPLELVHPARPPSPPRRAPAPVVVDGDYTPKAGARAMLSALRAAYPRPLTRPMLGVHSVTSHQTGTFSDYLSALRSHGLIRTDRDFVELTEEAVEKVPTNGPLRTSRELLQAWGPKLKGASRRMLEILVEAHGRRVSREELAEKAGVSAQTGTFSDYLSLLRSRGLLVDEGRDVAAAPGIFLGDV